jgi:hypothetical protein
MLIKALLHHQIRGRGLIVTVFGNSLRILEPKLHALR